MKTLLLNASAHQIPLKPGSVHVIATSPPYYGLRDYGLPPTEWPAVTYTPMAGLPAVTVPAWSGCLGMEPDPLMFVGHMVMIGREWWRVLRDDGTLWVNFGDSYANDEKWGGSSGGKHPRSLHGNSGVGRQRQQTGLKPKDLMGIPWRVAMALQADGWYLRSDVIWAKNNPMPESVTDRPTKAHEYVFLLSKRQSYYYDHVAVKETAVNTGGGPFSQKYAQAQPAHGGDSQHRKGGPKGRGRQSWNAGSSMGNPQQDHSGWIGGDGVTRNRRSVWNVNPKPYPGAHFATWPPELVETMIKASTSEHGVCPDCGAPWVRVVEKGQPTPRPDNPNPVLPYDPALSGCNGRNNTTLHMQREITTVGWRPSCDCPERDPIPAVVLDPFAGSCTTLQVARALGRTGIGTDLSLKYLQQEGRSRLGFAALDAFNNGSGIKGGDALDGLPLFQAVATC